MAEPHTQAGVATRLNRATVRFTIKARGDGLTNLIAITLMTHVVVGFMVAAEK